MKHMLRLLVLLLAAGVTIISCKKEVTVTEEPITEETLTKIYNHGFGTSNVTRVEEGYLVEGDIILTEEFLSSVPGGNFLRIANEEQYRTTNLVDAPRVITVSLDNKLSAKPGYSAALAEMVSRYNSSHSQISYAVFCLK